MALVNTNTKKQIVQVVKVGTPFVLPKNATIVSATKTSGVSTFTTTCDGLTKTIEDLLETYACYGTAFSGSGNGGDGNQTQFLERNQINFYSILLNGNEFVIDESANSSNVFNGTSIINKIKQTELKDLLVDLTVTGFRTGNNDPELGETVVVSFKTTPKIVPNLFFKWKGSCPGCPQFEWLTKTEALSALSDRGITVPNCVDATSN